MSIAEDEAGVVNSALPAGAAAPRASKGRGEGWIVFALTAFSAVLCFNRLNHPPMLIDESLTYWRICGTMGEMLDTLRHDAFTPLHYELLNWIRNGMPLGFGIRIVRGGIIMTPAVMRFVPALSGTLMTPVMYFLARQLFNRRTAVIAAAFIACSAYGLFFSRYAKMYASAWMLETLSIACFAWWMNSEKRLAWLCWIATGIAAGGFHGVTFLVIIPLPILYFVSMFRFGGWRVPMLIGGVVLIGVGPAIYYEVFNQWMRNTGGLVPGVVGKSSADANWDASGLAWLDAIDNSFEAPFRALNAYLSGFEWSSLDDLAEPAPFVQKFGAAMVGLAVATYGLFIFGALPWPHLRNPALNERTVQPWWRSALWLMIWIVMPVYGFFYCRSVPDFCSPMVWITAAWEVVRPVWWEAVIGATLIAAALNFLPKAGKFLAIPVLLVAVAAVVQTGRNKLEWMDYLSRPTILVDVLAIPSALIFHFSGSKLSQRCVQLLRFVGINVIVLGMCEIMFFAWTWMQKISMRNSPDLAWQTVWHIRYVAIVWPAVWLAAAALIARLPTAGLRIAAVVMICSFNLVNGLARQVETTEVPLDRVMGDVFSSQPNSATRTYFDLDPLLHSTFFAPMAMYYASIAARLQPTPEEFRVDESWPFEYGDAARQFKSECIYNDSISSDQIRGDIAGDRRISRVIVWEVTQSGGDWLFDPTDGSGLNGPWKLASDEQIDVYWNWDWTSRWSLRRREFDRQ